MYTPWYIYAPIHIYDVYWYNFNKLIDDIINTARPAYYNINLMS